MVVTTTNQARHAALELAVELQQRELMSSQTDALSDGSHYAPAARDRLARASAVCFVDSVLPAWHEPIAEWLRR